MSTRCMDVLTDFTYTAVCGAKRLKCLSNIYTDRNFNKSVQMKDIKEKGNHKDI